jgi:hypothetical protein
LLDQSGNSVPGALVNDDNQYLPIFGCLKIKLGTFFAYGSPRDQAGAYSQAPMTAEKRAMMRAL